MKDENKVALLSLFFIALGIYARTMVGPSSTPSGDAIGKYYTITEVNRTNQGEAAGITNRADPGHLDMARALADNILDPLIDKFGKVPYIESWFRNIAVNDLVGGSDTSEHLVGGAADLKAGSTQENHRMVQTIFDLSLPFNQLILEYGTVDQPGTVHVSYRANGKREVRWRKSAGNYPLVSSKELAKFYTL